MRFLDGITATRKEELLGQLRAVWTHDSTAIEGNTLSLGDTMFVLQYGLTVKGKPLKDQLDVQNHARAVDRVMSICERGSLREEDVFDLHRLVINEQSFDIYKPVGAYKREDNGTYRPGPDGKSVYRPYLPADDVPLAMLQWLRDFNALYRADAEVDDLVEAYVKAHVGLTAIHPFYDGNGRMARLLSNLPVLFAGCPPIVIPLESREDYLKAIWAADGGDLEPFKSLVRKVWQTTLDLVNEARDSGCNFGLAGLLVCAAMSASAAFVAPQIDCALCSQADLDGAADVLERCRIVKPVPGMPRPAFKPGACPAERNDYGDHWWSLDYALIVEGAKWLDFSTGEDLVENLSAVQEADGRVRLWSVDRFGASQNVREPIGSLPKFFETVPAVARMSARREIRQKALRLLERNLAWWRRNRRDDETGLFSAVFEETFVPNTTWRSGHYAPVDTNVELSLGFAGAAELAETLGEREAAARYRAEAEAVLAAVAKFCFGTDGLYYPYLLKERRRMEELKSGAMFAAFRVPEPTGNVRLLAALKGPAFGWDRFPITSIARTDKTFNVRDGDYRGNSSWQGATWTLMNDAAIRALGACGRRDVALELARKTIAEFKSNYAEFLNPDTGRGNGMLKYGWTAAQFIRILFEELYGLSYTAEKGLVCSPAPDFDGSLKGLRLPDGSTANVRVCAGKAQVTVVGAGGAGN